MIVPTAPELFRRCREARGLSAAGQARALLVAAPNQQRWETGERVVPGPAWVALYHLTKERGLTGLAAEIAALNRSGLSRNQRQPGREDRAGSGA
jgi:transcriptional regulator with XRE-family HTH domain